MIPFFSPLIDSFFDDDLNQLSISFHERLGWTAFIFDASLIQMRSKRQLNSLFGRHEANTFKYFHVRIDFVRIQIDKHFYDFTTNTFDFIDFQILPMSNQHLCPSRTLSNCLPISNTFKICILRLCDSHKQIDKHFCDIFDDFQIRSYYELQPFDAFYTLCLYALTFYALLWTRWLLCIDRIMTFIGFNFKELISNTLNSTNQFSLQTFLRFYGKHTSCEFHTFYNCIGFDCFYDFDLVTMPLCFGLDANTSLALTLVHSSKIEHLKSRKWHQKSYLRLISIFYELV